MSKDGSGHAEGYIYSIVKAKKCLTETDQPWAASAVEAAYG